MFDNLKEIAKDFKDDMSKIKELKAEWDLKWKNLANFDTKEEQSAHLLELCVKMAEGYKTATSSVEKSFFKGMIEQMQKKVDEEQAKRT
ncbi:hypothetical protein KAR91_86785 [Candidatus Pacearchaeota archaeon]|nr:hypothetical protein [Candidatus Pacearchaeota archaeon]